MIEKGNGLLPVPTNFETGNALISSFPQKVDWKVCRLFHQGLYLKGIGKKSVTFSVIKV